MSKGYTISYFIREIEKLSNKDLNRNDIYDLLSPRLGFHSVKSTALDNFLSSYVTASLLSAGTARRIAFSDTHLITSGKTPRTRLLRALKSRKKTGFGVARI